MSPQPLPQKATFCLPVLRGSWLVPCPWRQENTFPSALQADTEQADLARERRELSEVPEAEKEELARIYVARGVEPQLARQVAVQLMAKDALGAHARDELGISEIITARPIQAALTSAVTFSVGAAAPLALVLLSPSSLLIPVVSAGSLLFLALLGFLGARTGGAEILKPIVWVTFWGRPCDGCHRRDWCNRGNGYLSVAPACRSVGSTSKHPEVLPKRLRATKRAFLGIECSNRS